jgi:hypothetical protein
MTKREMTARLLALRAERDELKEAVIDAVSLLIALAATFPHEGAGDCAHCATLVRALEIGRPLERYRAEFDVAMVEFARDQPERYAEIRRGVFEGAGRVS